jgi:hypothetical protein
MSSFVRGGASEGFGWRTTSRSVERGQPGNGTESGFRVWDWTMELDRLMRA